MNMAKVIPKIKVYLLMRIIYERVFGGEDVVGVFARRADAEKKILELNPAFAYRIEERLLE